MLMAGSQKLVHVPILQCALQTTSDTDVCSVTGVVTLCHSLSVTGGTL